MKSKMRRDSSDINIMSSLDNSNWPEFNALLTYSSKMTWNRNEFLWVRVMGSNKSHNQSFAQNSSSVVDCYKLTENFKNLRNINIFIKQ